MSFKWNLYFGIGLTVTQLWNTAMKITKTVTVH